MARPTILTDDKLAWAEANKQRGMKALAEDLGVTLGSLKVRLSAWRKRGSPSDGQQRLINSAPLINSKRKPRRRAKQPKQDSEPDLIKRLINSPAEVELELDVVKLTLSQAAIAIEKMDFIQSENERLDAEIERMSALLESSKPFTLADAHGQLTYQGKMDERIFALESAASGTITPDLESMSFMELHALAGRMGVVHRGKPKSRWLSKAEVIDALRLASGSRKRGPGLRNTGGSTTTIVEP